MVSGFISRIVILVFGTLYPAYASYKAVRTKNVREYVKWMMYWIVFALFTCAETFTDLLLSFWFPFYYEIKIITVIYLLSPATNGSSILYRKFVHPVLIKREQEIDEYIAKAKAQGYHTMLHLGSKGFSFASSIIMQTAIKGVRSYSLGDLSGKNSREINGKSADVADSLYGQDPRLLRGNMIQGPHSPTPSTGQTGLYFPEADLSQRPSYENFRQFPSYEDISSGYSSGDPYYYAMQQPKDSNLVRTASLGPTSRIRTRASAKQGLHDRSSFSEEGSAPSAMEPYESQNESDNRFNYPLAHSASFPLVYPPSSQYFHLPEYQQMFRHLAQNQVFNFINDPHYSRFFGSESPLENTSERVYNNVKDEKIDSPSVVISEENSDNCKNQLADEFFEVIAPRTDSSKRNEEKNYERSENTVNETENDEETKTTKMDFEVEQEKRRKSENVCISDEDLCSKQKSFHERSGKYNKKPAPTPPTEELKPEEEMGFFTPNASPKQERKHISLVEKYTGDNEIEVKPQNVLEIPKKCKSKAKKTDLNIQKKLHMPKMSFSFWHQKGCAKQSSASESSSIASVEISANSESKNYLEYFIPLRDDDDRIEGNDKSIRIRNSPQSQERRKEEAEYELDLMFSELPQEVPRRLLVYSLSQKKSRNNRNNQREVGVLHINAKHFLLEI